MEIIRATQMPQQAGAYYVRIQGMARKHHITLEAEFDEHDTPTTQYIVAIEDYLPVATCRLYPLDSERMMLSRIVVLQEYRHQGLGTRVVQEAEEWARQQGFRSVVLESREEKVAFYERMGYRADPAKVTEGTFRCIEMERQL